MAEMVVECKRCVGTGYINKWIRRDPHGNEIITIEWCPDCRGATILIIDV